MAGQFHTTNFWSIFKEQYSIIVLLFVRVRRDGFMVDRLGHYNSGRNNVFESLELYISSVPSSQREATGGPHWRQREATEASCRAQVLTWHTESSPVQHRQDP